MPDTPARRYPWWCRVRHHRTRQSATLVLCGRIFFTCKGCGRDVMWRWYVAKRHRNVPEGVGEGSTGG